MVNLLRAVGREGQGATLALPGLEFSQDLAKPRVCLCEFLEGFNEPFVIGHPEPLGPVRPVFVLAGRGF